MSETASETASQTASQTIVELARRLGSVKWERDPNALAVLPAVASMCIGGMNARPAASKAEEARDVLHAMCTLTCVWLGIHSSPNVVPFDTGVRVSPERLAGLYRFTLGELRKGLCIGITAGGTPVRSELDGALCKELETFAADNRNMERALGAFTQLMTEANIWQMSGFV